MVNQDFLKSLGFSKDTLCPDGANRWEKTVLRDDKTRNCWVSITLDAEGGRAVYGTMNFYEVNGRSERPYDFISDHRWFDGEISEEDFQKFLDRQVIWEPSTLANRIKYNQA